MKEFIKSLWNQGYEDQHGRRIHPHQWWMVMVTLVCAFLVLGVAVVKFSWVIAGAIGAAGWEYKDQILEFLTKQKEDRTDG